MEHPAVVDEASQLINITHGSSPAWQVQGGVTVESAIASAKEHFALDPGIPYGLVAGTSLLHTHGDGEDEGAPQGDPEAGQALTLCVALKQAQWASPAPGGAGATLHLFPLIRVYAVSPQQCEAVEMTHAVWLPHQSWCDVLHAVLPLMEEYHIGVQAAHVGTQVEHVLQLNDSLEHHEQALREGDYRITLQLQSCPVKARTTYVNVYNGTDRDIMVDLSWVEGEQVMQAKSRVWHTQLPSSETTEVPSIRVRVADDASSSSWQQQSLEGIVVMAEDDVTGNPLTWIANDDIVLVAQLPDEEGDSGTSSEASSPTPSASPASSSSSPPPPPTFTVLTYTQAQGRILAQAWFAPCVTHASYGADDVQSAFEGDIDMSDTAGLSKLLSAVDRNLPVDASYGAGERHNVLVYRNTATEKLHLEERKWLNERQPVCRESLIALLKGSSDAACVRARELLSAHVEDGDETPCLATPVLGLAASGGGIRAMLSASAAMDGMAEVGVLGCLSYAVGLSGSTWAIGPWMCHEGNVHHGTGGEDDVWVYPHKKESWPKCKRKGSHTMVTQGSWWGKVATHSVKGIGSAAGEYMWRRLKHLLQTSKNWLCGRRTKERVQERPFSVVDIYSMILADFLLSHHFDGHKNASSVSFATLNNRLSNLRRSDVPIPVMTAVTPMPKAGEAARAHSAPELTSARRFRWVTFTPWEATCGREAIRTKALGQNLDCNGRVKNGTSVEELAYLMAVCGSAFAVDWKMLRRMFGLEDDNDPSKSKVLRMLEWMVSPRLQGSTNTVVSALNSSAKQLFTLGFVKPKERTVSAFEANVPRFVDLGAKDDTHPWTPLRDAGIDFNIPIPALSPCSGRTVDFIICMDASADAKDATELRVAVEKGYIAVHEDDEHLLTDPMDPNEDDKHLLSDPKNPKKGKFWCALRPPPDQPHMPYIFYIMGSTVEGTFSFNYSEKGVDELCDRVHKRFRDKTVVEALRVHIAACVIAKEQLLRDRENLLPAFDPVLKRDGGGVPISMDEIFLPNEELIHSLQKLSTYYCDRSVRPAATSGEVVETRMTDVATFVAPNVRFAECMSNGEWPPSEPKQEPDTTNVPLSDVWTHRLKDDEPLKRIVLQCDIPGSGGTALAHAMGSKPENGHHMWHEHFDACLTVRLSEIVPHVHSGEDVLPAILTLMGVPEERLPAAVKELTEPDVAGRILWILDGHHEVEDHDVLGPWLLYCMDGNAHPPAWLENMLLVTRTLRQTAMPPPEVERTLYVTLNDWTEDQVEQYVNRRFTPSSHAVGQTPGWSLCRENVLALRGLRRVPMYWHMASMLAESGVELTPYRAHFDAHALFRKVEETMLTKTNPGRHVSPSSINSSQSPVVAACRTKLGDHAQALHEGTLLELETDSLSMGWVCPHGGAFVHSAWKDYYFARFLHSACDRERVNFSEVLRTNIGREKANGKGGDEKEVALQVCDAQALAWLSTFLVAGGQDEPLRELCHYAMDYVYKRYYKCKCIPKNISAVLGSWDGRARVRQHCCVDVLCAFLKHCDRKKVAKDELVKCIIGNASNKTGGSWFILRRLEWFSPLRLEPCLLEAMARSGCMSMVEYFLKRNKGQRDLAVAAAKHGGQDAVVQTLGEEGK